MGFAGAQGSMPSPLDPYAVQVGMLWHLWPGLLAGKARTHLFNPSVMQTAC